MVNRHDSLSSSYQHCLAPTKSLSMKSALQSNVCWEWDTLASRWPHVLVHYHTGRKTYFQSHKDSLPPHLTINHYLLLDSCLKQAYRILRNNFHALWWNHILGGGLFYNHSVERYQQIECTPVDCSSHASLTNYELMWSQITLNSTQLPIIIIRFKSDMSAALVMTLWQRFQ